jgi:hypothetical protein
MDRTIISIILVGVGVYALLIWEAGSRTSKIQTVDARGLDLSAIVFVCFGVPLYFLSKRFFKKAQTRSN